MTPQSSVGYSVMDKTEADLGGARFGRYCSGFGKLQAVTSNYGVTDNATV
jgi:hypothetical protein